ncbi:ABC transporter ATP-binding protein [Streptomyces sp. NPDC058232]|uniref:ABC transporter ATP-binding protein n=1 Tax=unclassified Streptomyces TaxID=2593676 RepID=UPI0028C394B4|nr:MULTISPECIES: ABC transporter ATP-binding protein [unclassified Streptomyces]WNO68239.1 ABC transporter ATP-binding protein [Streptomyces sp. AM2-3-1]WSC72899.1 ABC transporter ATP-binding protein/permease [Streptomyces sp. NBC_01760]WTI90627.1 ABC transporter ATP-binding protein/permease [Streptomyces sp. NBC_00724]
MQRTVSSYHHAHDHASHRPGTLDHRYRGEHPVRTLGYLLRPDRRRIAVAAAVFVVKHSPVWLLPLITANIIDVVVQHRPERELWLNAGALLCVLLLNYPMHLLYVRCLGGSVRRMGTALRDALCRRMQQLSIGYHSRTSAGVLQAKVVRDVESVEQMVQQSADMGLAAVITLSGGLTVIAVRVPSFLPVFLVVVPAAALLVMRLRARLRSHNESFRQEVEQLSARVSEMTSLIPITRAHGLERTALGRVDGSLRQVFTAGLRLDLLNGRFGALAWILLNSLGVACLAGSALVAYHGWLPITAGDVVMLSAFFTTLTGSMTTLLSLAPIISKGLESVRSAGEVLQAPDLESNAGKDRVDEVQGRIDFEGVGFGYEGVDGPAVEDFTLSARPGETVALVGASGAGKSTVLNLLIGFIRPTSGRILLDGTDMATLDLRSYRRFLSVVPQDSILFEGTIRENVTYGMGETDEHTVRQALRDANALDFVEDLPDGLSTVVGERGARLSGGQKQRLAIARALIRDPRVLILDEATSALDTRSEALVQEALARLIHGRTVFVVAHRLSTIRAADRIVAMDRGRIAEVGTHEELVDRGGVYAGLQPARSA